MKEIIMLVEELKKSPIKSVVDQKIKDFENVRKKGKDEIFRELCFCILTAGTSAELGIKTINHIGDAIFNGNELDIRKKLKEIYRFHTLRANYIFLARNSFNNINLDEVGVRENIVKNIKGIGMKEASHFLRNIGFKDFAIIDFHIVDLLVDYGLLLEKPKTLSTKKYLEIESILREIAEKTNTNLGELDLYLWYKKTGKVLK